MTANPNPKSLLNELAQKAGVSLPVYNTDHVEGPPHDPVWKSIVTFINPITGEAESVCGDVAKTKALAELNAAQSVFYSLGARIPGAELTSKRISSIPPNRLTISKSEPSIPKVAPKPETGKRKLAGKCLIMVDAENKPKFAEEFCQEFDTTETDVEVYAYSKHPVALLSYDPRVQVITHNSPMPNASDILMTMNISKRFSEQHYDRIIIATSDKFGEVIAQLDKRVVCVPSVKFISQL